MQCNEYTNNFHQQKKSSAILSHMTHDRISFSNIYFGNWKKENTFILCSHTKKKVDPTTEKKIEKNNFFAIFFIELKKKI